MPILFRVWFSGFVFCFYVFDIVDWLIGGSLVVRTPVQGVSVLHTPYFLAIALVTLDHTL